MTNASSEVDDRRVAVEDRLLHQRPAQDRDGDDPAPPAGDDGAAVGVAGEPPHGGLEHPPAVERQAGHQVEGADQQVGAGEAPTAIRTSPSGTTNHRPGRRPPTASEVSGPTTAIMNSWRGLRASPSIAVMPPRKWRVIEATGKP